MTKTIVLKISPQGETQLETRGFSGSVCRSASHFLETALGVRATEQTTPEFHEMSSATGERLEQRAS